MSDITDFAQRLLAKGIELTLRHNRLGVWPGKMWKRLTDADRAFIDAHRYELKDMVRAGEQPRLPDDYVAPSVDTVTGPRHPDSVDAPREPAATTPTAEPAPLTIRLRGF
jgi:hypothetical protein